MKIVTTIATALLALCCACGPTERSPNDNASPSAETSLSVIDTTQGDKPLRLAQLLIWPEAQTEWDQARNEVRQEWEISGTFVNESTEPILDLEVEVEWLSGEGRKIAEGHAFVKYTGGNTGLPPNGGMAMFRLPQTLAFKRDEWQAESARIHDSSKVRLTAKSGSRTLAYAPQVWERLVDPPMRPASRKEAVAIREKQDNERRRQREARLSEAELAAERGQQVEFVEQTAKLLHEGDVLMNDRSWSKAFTTYDEAVKKIADNEPHRLVSITYEPTIPDLLLTALCGRAASRAMLGQHEAAVGDYVAAYETGAMKEGVAAGYGQKQIESAYDEAYELFKKKFESDR